MECGILDLSDAEVRRRLYAYLDSRRGPHYVEVKRWRPKHSEQARAYYYVAVVSALMRFFREQGDIYGKDDCHEILKENCMPAEEIIDHRTGELLGMRRKSIKEMDVPTLAAYIDRCIAWLGERGIPVAPPTYRTAEDQPSNRRARVPRSRGDLN